MLNMLKRWKAGEETNFQKLGKSFSEVEWIDPESPES